MKCILWLILFLAGKLNAQNLIEENFPTKDGLISYSAVIEVDSGLTETDLYLNAKHWLVDAFKSSKAAIQIDDKELKVIVVRSYVQGVSMDLFDMSVDKKFWFTLKIETKNGRYRYSLDDITYEAHVISGSIKVDVEESFEGWLENTISATANEKKRKKLYSDWNDSCKTINKGFKNIISSLEQGMKVKNNKDW